MATQLVLDWRNIRKLERDPAVLGEVDRIALDMAAEMAAAAPRLSGGGASSIAARVGRRAGTAGVGWDEVHYYMLFPEYGTDNPDGSQKQREQRFARDVWEQYQLD